MINNGSWKGKDRTFFSLSYSSFILPPSSLLGIICMMLLSGCLYNYNIKPDYFQTTRTAFNAEIEVPQELPDTVDINTCVNLVLANNPDIAQAQADSEMAQYGVDIALSYLIPKVKLEAANMFFDDEIYALYGYTDTQMMTAKLSAQYLLYDFGISRYMLGQRYRETDAARAGIRVASDNLAFAAVQLYYTILAMEADLEALLESQKTLEARLKDARSLFKAGRIPESQVLTLEVAFEELVYNRTALANGRYKALISLKNMMGLPLDHEVSLNPAGRDMPDTLPDMDALLAAADEFRPEIIAAQAMIESSQFGIDAAEAMRWPLFLIGAEINYSDLDKETLDDGTTAQAMISMSWDLYDGGEKAAKIAIEETKLRKARLALKSARDMIRKEVMIALADVTELQAQQTSLDLAVKSAARNLADINALHQAQKAKASEVVDAQTAMLNAMMNQHKARYALLTALYAIEKSAGVPLSWFDKKEPAAALPVVPVQEVNENEIIPDLSESQEPIPAPVNQEADLKPTDTTE